MWPSMLSLSLFLSLSHTRTRTYTQEHERTLHRNSSLIGLRSTQSSKSGSYTERKKQSNNTNYNVIRFYYLFNLIQQDLF